MMMHAFPGFTAAWVWGLEVLPRPPLEIPWLTLPVVAGMFVALWLISLLLRDASIVDPCWGFSFILIAATSAACGESITWRSWLLLALTIVWGSRLSVYLLWRNWGRGEDRRYAAMRSHHGRNFWWVSLLTVFLLQAVVAWVVSLPVQLTIAAGTTAPFGWLDVLGLSFWGVGLFFETVGDWQLARFQADPRNAGKVMDRGLWRYTRHPNYFGDCCVWWGFYLLSVAAGFAWTVFSPMLMTWLLLRVSGVLLLERTIEQRRPEYAEYRQRTSPFFPWPPRSRAT
jgi:steroid 5-alpha reductase family enzyme